MGDGRWAMGDGRWAKMILRAKHPQLLPLSYAGNMSHTAPTHMPVTGGMPLTKSALGVFATLASGELLLLRHVVGIGLNYAAHAHEQGKPAPERPVLFSKNTLACALNGDTIVIPKICQDKQQVDFETELAVVLGTAPANVGTGAPLANLLGQPNGLPNGLAHGSGAKLIKDVSEADALSCVLGYCVANDISARWWQKDGSGGQFYRGKSFDSFCPLGPFLTPAANVPNPQALRLFARLNGVEMQNSSTSDMIFSVARLIAEMSRGTSLLPGTVILTGTPSGVGFARTPQVFMKPGDTIEVEVESLGVLSNLVADE